MTTTPPDEVRQALADAANTVDGVKIAPYFRQVTKPGAGMVRRDWTEWPNPFGASITWQIVIFLPQDIAAAERWVDDHADQLANALRPELHLESITQQQLPLESGLLPIVLIQGQREG